RTLAATAADQVVYRAGVEQGAPVMPVLGNGWYGGQLSERPCAPDAQPGADPREGVQHRGVGVGEAIHPVIERETRLVGRRAEDAAQALRRYQLPDCRVGVARHRVV